MWLLIWGMVASAQDWTPDASAQQVHRALSLRHNVLPCEEVEALTPTPVQTLRDMVEHVRAPAWVPMRAATCLATRHGATVQADLLAWVSDEATLGLGMHLLNHLDDMDEAVANAVAERALREGPEALEARSRIARSSRPSTQALVAP